MKHLLAAVLIFLTFQSTFAGNESRNNIPVTPDTNKTPGEFCSTNDPDFKELRYAEKMAYCQRNVDQWLKTKIYKQYSVSLECKHRYTVDHLVPLALGGNNSPENLWPEHVLVKQTRQELEQDLYESVRKGDLHSEDAVKIILEAKLKLKLDLSTIKGCG